MASAVSTSASSSSRWEDRPAYSQQRSPREDRRRLPSPPGPSRSSRESAGSSSYENGSRYDRHSSDSYRRYHSDYPSSSGRDRPRHTSPGEYSDRYDGRAGSSSGTWHGYDRRESESYSRRESGSSSTRPRRPSRSRSRSRSPQLPSRSSRSNGASSRRSRSRSPPSHRAKAATSVSASTPIAPAPPPPPFFYKALGKTDFMVQYSPELMPKDQRKGKEIVYRYDGQGLTETPSDPRRRPLDTKRQKLVKKINERMTAPLQTVSYHWDKNSTGPPPPSPPSAILVTGYPGSTSSHSIRDFFTTFGRIASLDVRMDELTGASLGICRIVFSDDMVRVGDKAEAIAEKSARVKSQSRPAQDGHTVALTAVLKGDGQKVGSAMLYMSGGVKVELDGDGKACQAAVAAELARRRKANGVSASSTAPSSKVAPPLSPDQASRSAPVKRPTLPPPPPPPPPTAAQDRAPRHSYEHPPPPSRSPQRHTSPRVSTQSLPAPHITNGTHFPRHSPSSGRANLPPPYAPARSTSPQPSSSLPVNRSLPPKPSFPVTQAAAGSSTSRTGFEPVPMSALHQAQAAPPPEQSVEVRAAVEEAIREATARAAQARSKAQEAKKLSTDVDARDAEAPHTKNSAEISARGSAVETGKEKGAAAASPNMVAAPGLAAEPPKKTSGWTVDELVQEAQEIIIGELVSAFSKDLRNKLISSEVKDQLAVVDAGGRATATARAAAAAAATTDPTPVSGKLLNNAGTGASAHLGAKDGVSLPSFSRRKASESASTAQRPAAGNATSNGAKGRRASFARSENLASSDEDPVPFRKQRKSTPQQKDTLASAPNATAPSVTSDRSRSPVSADDGQDGPRARRQRRRPSHITADYTSDDDDEEDVKPIQREDTVPPSIMPVDAPVEDLPIPPLAASTKNTAPSAAQRRQSKPGPKRGARGRASASVPRQYQRRTVGHALDQPPPLLAYAPPLTGRQAQIEAIAYASAANSLAADSLHYYDPLPSVHRPLVSRSRMRTGKAPEVKDEPAWYRPLPLQFGEPVHVGRNLSFGSELSTAHFVSSMSRYRPAYELYGHLAVLPPILDPRCIDMSKLDPTLDPDMALQKEEYRIHRRLRKREKRLEALRKWFAANGTPPEQIGTHAGHMMLQYQDEDDATFEAAWVGKLARALDRRRERAAAMSRVPRETPDPFDLGIAADEEDMYYCKLALERLKAGQDMHSDPPLPEDEHAPVSSHPSGSARSEGYYKITLAEKMASRQVTNHPGAAVDDVAAATATGKAVSRLARATNRGVVRDMEMTKKVAATDTDVLKFNQLRTRKKQLTFARSGIEGYGLFAKEYIPAGDMVIEYVGELIRQQVADRREKAYERQGIGSSYLFRVDEDLVVDATKKGNLGRLINHCCVPNCTARIITINNSKKIVIYAKADIAPGEEVTYDYHFAHEEVKIPCLCGHPLCRKYLN